jgi:hypothetical protein
MLRALSIDSLIGVARAAKGMIMLGYGATQLLGAGLPVGEFSVQRRR